MQPLPLTDRISGDAPGGPVLLDGGTATELERRGHDLDDALWSARLLLDDPAAIIAVHRSFLEAGAEVVTTASYQLAATSLASAGRDPGGADALLARSVAVAREAVDGFVADGGATRGGRRPLVAASVGPYGAVLADASEYRGGYERSEAELARFHAPRIAALLAAGADALAVETVPSAVELAALARVLVGAPVPIYASVTLDRDGRSTAEGQPLAEAFDPLLALDEVVAVGVNCCPPALVLPALEQLAPLGRPLVAKPNVGRRWDPLARRWVEPDDGGAGPASADDVAAWVSAGARLVGGCCGTEPQHLRRLAEGL